MATATHAWDIYARSLIHLGHGYPLWMPDPDPGTPGGPWEVEIGDVGWIRQGSFKHLLRCRNRAEDPQPHMAAVGEDYEQFAPRNLVITGPRERIAQPVLHSRSVKNIELFGGVSTNVPTLPASPSANISFKCTDDSGALLWLSPHGEETFIESRRHIITHLRANIDKWERYANETLGLELKQEDIYFVCGVTKTCRWAVAAFQDSQYDAQGSIACDFGAVGANISFSISNTSAPGGWYRAGPPQTRMHPLAPTLSAPAAVSSSTHSSSTSPAPSLSPHRSAQPSRHSFDAGSVTPSFQEVEMGVSPKADQCIFFHYYKVKRRWWILPQRIEAGAGPHQLPPGAYDGDADMRILTDDSGEPIAEEYREFEMGPDESKPFDPVNAVLDYILSNSEAEIAIASDLDLYAFFRDGDFPEDVAEALAQMKPVIDIDEDGVGTLSVDITYTRKRSADSPESSPSKRRALSPSAPPEPGAMGSNDMDIDSERTHSGPPRTGRDPAADDKPLNPGPPTDRGPQHEKGKEVIRAVMGDSSSHEGSVTVLAYSLDGRFLASGSEDTTVIVWHALEGAIKRRIPAHDDTVSALAFSPDGTRLASASEFGPVKLWMVDALQLEPTIMDDTICVRSLAFTPDGSMLLGGASDGSFVAWNVGNSERLDISQDRAVISFITFSPEGRLMATGGTDETCNVWELDRLDAKEPKLVLEGHRGMVSSASFSPDGRRIVTGSDDCSCCIWSTETGNKLVNLHEHTGPVWSVCFSPDGSNVASGSSDATVKICDSWTGQTLISLEGHDNLVNAVTYSPDGTYIASASSDNTVRLWNSKDGTCNTTYNEHSDNVISVQFSPDGTTLASGSHDGTVYIRAISAPSAEDAA
ncbi:WD40 repeat-like protein [Trametes cingulata]|nr:WD40 repeat-like protein [Trametes cingulata]